MDQRNWFFGQVLDEADLDEAFTRAENAINASRIGPKTSGVVKGCQVYARTFDNNTYGVDPGVVVGPNGERIEIRGTAGPDGPVGGYITTDSDGNDTAPGPGLYRWITIAARFGRTMDNSETDDTANAVFTKLTDSWNAAGLANMTDATQAANQALDGGYQLDNFGFCSTGFLCVAGPTNTIGGPLTYGALPSDAVILADILYTDGDLGSVLADSAISFVRRQVAYEVSSNPHPDYVGFGTNNRRLLWEIQTGDYKTRFYATFDGLEITTNAVWDGGSETWSADNSSYFAQRVVFWHGAFRIDSQRSAETGSPWTDAHPNPAGWTCSMDFGNQTNDASHSSTFDMTGNIIGNGVQTGYVSWGGTLTGTFSNPGGFAAIQFPRKFASVPSSVTLGSAGPNETNVSGVATGNLKTSGCDFRVSATGTGQTIAQRTYTATQ